MTDSSYYENQLTLIAKELAHREKNSLAIVASIFRQICKHSKTIDQVKETFDKWLGSYKKTHEMLTDSGLSNGISLKERLEIELHPYHHESVTITGEDIFLKRNVALTLGMCIHECTTNSVKYGALSVEEGKIDIHLEIKNNNFEMTWIEKDGPKIDQNKMRKPGFGTLLLKTSFVDTLKGSYDFKFPETGFNGRIIIPLKTFE